LAFNCEIDNKMNDSDVKDVKLKLIKMLELRERPVRTLNQHSSDETYTENEVIIKVNSEIVKSGETSVRQVVVPVS
jgi:hypothetical protein